MKLIRQGYAEQHTTAMVGPYPQIVKLTEKGKAECRRYLIEVGE